MRRLRAYAAVAVAAIALIGSGGCSQGTGNPKEETPKELQKVTYLTGFSMQAQDSFMFLAKEKGFFRDAGFDVTIEGGKGTGENLKLVLGGQAQFGIVDLTGAIIALGNGQAKDFTVVTAIYQRTVSAIMTLDDKNITSPKDLEGKTIGYQPGGVNYTLFPTYAKLAGIDANKVKWESVQPQQLTPLLVTGKLHAITQTVLAKPSVESAANGRKSVTLAYSDYLTDLYGNALAVSSKLAKDNPDMVKRFRDAMLKGLEYAMEHPDEAGQAMAKEQKQMKADLIATEFSLAIPYIRSSASGVAVGAMSEERVARNIAILQAANAIPASITPSQLVSFDLAPKS